MKARYLILLAFAFFAAAFVSVVSVDAQSPTAAPNPFLDQGSNTTETLHNAIIKQPYTFEVGGWKMHLTFKSDGTGSEEDWQFKWHAKDGHTVELSEVKFGKTTGKKTTLTFDDDYSSYTGFHFDGTTKVAGKKVEKPAQ